MRQALTFWWSTHLRPQVHVEHGERLDAEAIGLPITRCPLLTGLAGESAPLDATAWVQNSLGDVRRVRCREKVLVVHTLRCISYEPHYN
jgi:hypothetical protein